jgi:pantoate--beta-alanine ligase
MAADLRLAVEIVICPIVRAADGLALSSRNAYLSLEERTQALVLRRALQAVEAAVALGERRGETLIETARAAFASEPQVRIDSIDLVDWATLEPLPIATPGALFAVAAYVGSTRLIDNTILG